MPDALFDAWIAERYELLWPELFDRALVDRTVDFLAALTGPGSGAALELGIGTGRIAMPLSRRGVRVHGIELSPAMAARVGAGIDVTVGDMASVTVGGPFRLVYLLRNTITNLTSQDAQVATFRNAAAQLAPGGCFVIENYVPELRRLPPGENVHLFTASAEHVAFEEYDVATQIAVSHHHWVIDGELRSFSSPHRYVWPSELDLMARLAGLTRHERWSGWDRARFTSESRHHISVWQKPPR